MFDAHVHILDPRFPLVENNGMLPDPFTVTDYRAATADLDVTGGAIISSSFQVGKQDFLRAALEELGQGWVAVAQLADTATDREIRQLDEAGVRGVRFNLRRGKVDIEHMTLMARRAYDLVGWHCEMYVDGAMLSSLNPVIAKLPALSIDHLGMSSDALQYLLELAERGARVKASGFGRVELDVVETLRQIHAVNPAALMFGTDLPGVRADRPFERTDLDLVAEAVGADLDSVLEHNAREFYRLPALPRPAKTKPMPVIELSEVTGEDDAGAGQPLKKVKKKLRKKMSDDG